MSDLGTEFNSNLIKKLCATLEISHQFAATDQHSSNLAERQIRDIVKFFRILSKNERKNW